MVDPISARSIRGSTLRNKFELERRRLSYTDHHYEDVKNRLNMAASPSNRSQKQLIGNQELERDEIVRHMSNLPSFLDPEKATPDRALSFGVMDWGRLEKWQYQHHKCSPSSSSSSPFFSTDGSTPQSTSGQSCFSARQKPHRVTLQCHFNRSSCLGNVDKFHNFKDATFYKRTEPKYCKLHVSDAPKVKELESSNDIGNRQAKSSLKGKMKIQDGAVNAPIETVKVLPTQFHGYGESTRNPSSASGNTNLQEKRSSFCSVKSDSNTGTFAADKPRNMSPNRRFSFGMISKSPASMSTTRSVESPVSQKSSVDTHVLNRAQSSPLRRLLEPLYSFKATSYRKSAEKSREDSKLKAKGNMHLRNSREVSNADSLHKYDTSRALFQTAVKNGRPLFTFAVENNNNVLAATVRDSRSSAKENSNCWIYTFFTVDEIKKKTGGWLSHSRRDKGHSYIPNMTAQMTVSNRSISKCDTREFSLYRVDPTRVDELAGIVVKFSRNVEHEEENQERFNTTVILPGGNHGVSSNGKPSPLIERWRSNGVCDCGGWDLGCRLRTLTNQVQCSRTNSPTGQFELFFQGDSANKRRFFSLCPLKEKIFSIEYNSSLSPLQAFSICISVLECRKSSEHTSSRTYEDKQVLGDPTPVRFASFPPLSPVGRV
uniref:uncharacterized protein LOC122581750 n=1 Tax=Erigeron canadensis TaxID=72917 RepID=UPI001CB9BBC6|nr:uncharacterized protein LOC122581750 [Erigeron canadensis]XP_043609957.1 uncharacterized protein LOC122581750 [Erigeron canadensis]